ncbi:MAG: glycosyltransferase family 39 protein [Myxococcota bacterium]
MSADSAFNMTESRLAVFFDAASVGVYCVLIALVFGTFGDYGTSWDEFEHSRYGDDIVGYFASGLSDEAVPDHHQNYGGGYNLAAALFSAWVPHPRHVANHLFTAILGLIGLLGTWRLGRLLGGAAGGLLALVLLASLPAYYGHMFNNPKDLPFAVGYVWALYYLARLIEAGPRAPLGLWGALGVAMGLAMTVRVGGLLCIAYLVLVVAAQWAIAFRQERDVRAAVSLGYSLAWRTLAASAVAWALMVLPWPAAHRAPWSMPFDSLSGFSEHGFTARTLFRGVRVSASPPPPDYLPGYFLVQLPDVLWCALALGLVLLLWMFSRPDGRGRLLGWRSAALGLLALSILFPIVYAIARRATVYDGFRHFLFVLPPLCVLAAVGVTAAVRVLAARSRPFAYALSALLVFGVGLTVADMARLHPYEYVYFNRASGGLEAAATRYETDYYAHSFKELSERLVAHLWTNEPERYLRGEYRVLGCGIMDYLMTPHLPANFLVAREPVLLRSPHNFDLYVAYRRGSCPGRRTNLPRVVEVARDGVVLNTARDMREDDRTGPTPEPERAGEAPSPNQDLEPGEGHAD